MDRLRAISGVEVRAQSGWYETRSAGGPPGQGPFLNGAALLETSLAPAAMLAQLQRIEHGLGRQPALRWGPRTLDLDLLLFDQQIVQSESLVLPHPRMAWRRFVLQGAAEIAPALLHPTTGWTLAQLLQHLDTATEYVAIAGPIGVGKTRLAEAVAARAQARLICEQPNWEHLDVFYRDPPSNAWALEVEFLVERAGLLAANRWPAAAGSALAVSDFWFDQSLAFARVWLPPAQYAAFDRRWRAARAAVVQPKLIVVLDAPAEQLYRQVVRRGRPCERLLQVAQLDRIREAVAAQAAQPNLGPVLRLRGDDWDWAIEEVLAAIEAMRP